MLFTNYIYIVYFIGNIDAVPRRKRKIYIISISFYIVATIAFIVSMFLMTTKPSENTVLHYAAELIFYISALVAAFAVDYINAALGGETMPLSVAFNWYFAIIVIATIFITAATEFGSPDTSLNKSLRKFVCWLLQSFVFAFCFAKNIFTSVYIYGTRFIEAAGVFKKERQNIIPSYIL